jgi:hypothetical protein
MQALRESVKGVPVALALVRVCQAYSFINSLNIVRVGQPTQVRNRLGKIAAIGNLESPRANIKGPIVGL